MGWGSWHVIFFYLFFLGGWGHNYMHACCLILVIVIPLELLIVMHSRSNYAADVLSETSYYITMGVTFPAVAGFSDSNFFWKAVKKV